MCFSVGIPCVFPCLKEGRAEGKKWPGETRVRLCPLFVCAASVFFLPFCCMCIVRGKGLCPFCVHSCPPLSGSLCCRVWPCLCSCLSVLVRVRVSRLPVVLSKVLFQVSSNI